MSHETGRPFLPGDNLGSSVQTGLGLEKWGFGVPGGAPKPTRTLRVTPRDWFQNRVSFDRPCLLVPDEDFTGVLYIFECNTAPGYCPGSANNLFSARKYRRGQTAFINRPGRYSLYFDDPRQTLQLLEYDWGSIWNDDPGTKYLTGWDPALPGFRGVGVTATDPAALLVSDTGAGGGLTALGILLTALNALVTAGNVILTTISGFCAGFNGILSGVNNWLTGTIICAVPGTAVQGGNHVPDNGKPIIVQALSTNTGNVWVGETDVKAQAHLIVLTPGDRVELLITNTNLIFVDAAVGGEGVGFMMEQ